MRANQSLCVNLSVNVESCGIALFSWVFQQPSVHDSCVHLSLIASKGVWVTDIFTDMWSGEHDSHPVERRSPRTRMGGKVLA